MRTRSQAAAARMTLASLPDEMLHLVIDACVNMFGVPLSRRRLLAACDGVSLVPRFEDVKGLGCVSKGVRQQLSRLQPLVGIRSLAVVQRPAHGPWRVTLLYMDSYLTAAVVEQAQQGRVRSIRIVYAPPLAPTMARRVVPELLGAGCSLLELQLDSVQMESTWAATFGEAAVCSAVLRTLHLTECRLRGPLPELRLPALQVLMLHNNQLTGGLEPLRGCTALQVLSLCNNRLTGDLEPLRGCTALRELGLEKNQLTGGLEAIRGFAALWRLHLKQNLMTPTDEEKAHFQKQCLIRGSYPFREFST